MTDGETKVTSLRLPVKLLERFKRAAAADRRTMGLALQIAMEDYCEKVEAEQKGKAAA